MTALQTTETVYKLFHWKSGTYAFEPRDVDLRPGDRLAAALRVGADGGVPASRRVAHRPAEDHLRRAMTFERVKELDPAAARAEGRGAGTASRRRWGRTSGGSTSWPSRASRWSGSSTSPGWASSRPRKALFNLVNLGVPARPSPPAQRSAAAEVGAYARGWQERRPARGRAGVLATVAIAVALAALVLARHRQRGAGAGRRCAPSTTTGPSASSPATSWSGCGRRWRSTGSRTGAYPRALDALVEAGLARPRDLRYPWSQAYAYRRQGDGYRPRCRRWSEGAPPREDDCPRQSESPSSVRVEFPDNDKVRVLCGAHQEHLKLVERRPGVQLGSRGQPDRRRRRRRGGAAAGRAAGARALRPRRRAVTRSTWRTSTRPPSWWRRA